MIKLDLMAKSQSFTIGNDIRVRAKKVVGCEYDFWVQDSTKKIRDTVSNIERTLKDLFEYKIPQIVFVKKSRLLGYAGYDYNQDILFISDVLHSEKEFEETLADQYFAARNIKDTLIHELTHKRHWDSAKAFYKINRKRYNNLKEAKAVLDSDLYSYVKKQQRLDFLYLKKNVSENAFTAFLSDNLNELVADVNVLDSLITDKNLLQNVKGVLRYGSNGFTE